MTGISIGDMARQFTSLRDGNAIKSELFELAESLSSGKVADLTKSLNGETVRFSGVQYSLTQLDGYQQVASETEQTLGNIQIILGKVDDTRATTAERLLLVNDSSTAAQVDEAARASQSSFEEMVTALNTKIADRALMSGNSVNVTPLATAETMLSDLQTAVGGALDPATIIATVDAWFNDPAGGFAVTGYQGDTGPALERQVTEDQSVQIDARADDPAVRQVLQGAALAALANTLPGLNQETKIALLTTSGSQLYGAASGLVAVQARIGFAEDNVARALTETTAQQSSLSQIVNDLSLADPFETATRLQAQQTQLETFFSITARLSQLSLLRYI
ncbi:flagellar hook-associated protein 3 FlgL [Yoonia maricola]|uniref:Flagellar hook-associated protein 3 FlgL n=1 Tax=Yoonia maricola TaxID=420999 RepID=A0A2M8W5A4_9RHOB|nr:flagellin [Yoonia maricola]PJI86102.1 flagellar hook-associated protein 3 FlgL [Yoonia maricola]